MRSLLPSLPNVKHRLQGKRDVYRPWKNRTWKIPGCEIIENPESHPVLLSDVNKTKQAKTERKEEKGNGKALVKRKYSLFPRLSNLYVFWCGRRFLGCGLPNTFLTAAFGGGEQVVSVPQSSPLCATTAVPARQLLGVDRDRVAGVVYVEKKVGDLNQGGRTVGRMMGELKRGDTRYYTSRNEVEGEG